MYCILLLSRIVFLLYYFCKRLFVSRLLLNCILFIIFFSASYGQPLGLDFYKQLTTEQELYQAKDSLGNIWIKGIISQDLIGKNILVQNRSVDMISYSLYTFKQDSLVQILPNVDLAFNPIKSRYPIFNFIPQSTEFFLNIKQNSPTSLHLVIHEISQFGQKTLIDILVLSMYYGFAIMCIIFNLSYYLLFRDVKFASYVLLQIGILLAFFYKDGMVYYFSNGEYTLLYLI